MKLIMVHLLGQPFHALKFSLPTLVWSCQTICSISHGKQYKLIYGLAGWHNSPERLKAFLYLSTLWPSLWVDWGAGASLAEAKDNCAHLSQSCWSERKESTTYTLNKLYQYRTTSISHCPHPTMSNCSLLLCFLFCRFFKLVKVSFSHWIFRRIWKPKS